MAAVRIMKQKLDSILNESKNKNLPFLIFRYPGENSVIASSQSTVGTSIEFSPFNKGKTIVINNLDILPLKEIDQYLPPKADKLRKKEYQSLHCATQSEYVAMVNNAKGQIQNNQIQKVVLSKVKNIPKSVNPIATYFNLEKKYSKAFVYCFYHPQTGLWIGASPEKLLEKKQHNSYHIHSIAGTKRLNEQWTQKEMIEQKFVTDYITSQLKENGISNLEITGPFDLNYGEIKHLKTSISFRTKIHSSDILKFIHPTPAVCGISVKTAQKIIHDLEGYDRSYYTGYMGIKNSSKGEESYFVNLRCMQVLSDNCYIYTGAGIVKDSLAEDEWNEVEAKAKTLIDCISING